MKIAREAMPFAVASGGLAVALAFFHPWASLPALALLSFILFFFRDPERVPPDDPRAVVSPADGRIVQASPSRVSIFLNLFDVHVCRAPLTGRVVAVRSVPGRFLAAFKDEASDQNERTAITIHGPRAEIDFTLVAGLVARRIVCKVTPGTDLEAGDRVGLIRFGSRVDVDLPAGAVRTVQLGERVVAGETILARLADRGLGPTSAVPV